MQKLPGLKAYRMQSTQFLYDEDQDLCAQAAAKLDWNFWPAIERCFNFFSDESAFYFSKHFNKHNWQFWFLKNQFPADEKVLHSAWINVCSAISSKSIIGPFFSDGAVVNKNDYLHTWLNEEFERRWIVVKKRLFWVRGWNYWKKCDNFGSKNYVLAGH